MHAGVPVAAVSTAYSLMSKDFEKLKSMIALLQPGAIYVSGMKSYGAALTAIAPLHQAKMDANTMVASKWRFVWQIVNGLTTNKFFTNVDLSFSKSCP